MTPMSELLGESPGIQAVRNTVGRLLAHGAEGHRLPPLLIQGETGTGKGLMARAIHRAGPRAAGPLVEVNCAAIPETLLEAELFGFARGAFTDAREAKAGLFQTAHGGTLFLDEVGLLPERVQAKFLKVLEDGAVRRLGSTRSEPADVALVAATSENLLDAVHGHRFREDLYHRLAVVTVRLPSLAERGPDILLLAEHFLGRACTDYGLAPKTLTPDARSALLAYSWPGNIRELANVMERAVLLTETPLVTVGVLGLPSASGLPDTTPEAHERARPLRDVLGTVERDHLIEALRETEWNIARAAARLRIPRGTLRYRIEKLGLRRSGSPPTRPGPPPIHAMPGPPAPPLRAGSVAGALPWERRWLAFLRAILVSPPNRDVVPDISGALEALIEKVESFGGRVEDLGPMGVVAVFGLEPVEDAPRRAAHAAIAIRRAAERAWPTTAERLGATIAIHASQGLVGQGSDAPVIDAEAKCQAYAVLEALVTVAEGNTILVSAAAASTLERRFELTPLSSVDPTRNLGSRLEGLERPGLARRGHMAPLVGRGRELEQLRHVLERATAGQGQVVAIVGEPGVGKSRLVWELTHSDRRRGWLIGHATAVSYGRTTPYRPVIDLLKAYCHIDERDDPRQIREKMRAKLLALDRALEPSLPALLALLDVLADDDPWQALDPLQRRQRTLDAIKRLWLREAQVQPLLLVLEDLHWVDAETQALLDALIESLPTARLCLLVDYRPEYQHGWASKTSYTQLRLDPLPPESAEELLQAILGADAGLQRLTALLIERTEGNPFFLEETVQALVETHALGGERGGHYLARPIDAIQVPVTVQAVLAARIDRLPREERRLLQAASVIGKRVPLALLRAVTELPEEALRKQLVHLQAAEFLYETSLVPDEYTFKHALTQEVAYGSLLDEWRRTLHARIVSAIEELHPERLTEHVDQLGHHAVRGELWTKAVLYLRQAGTKAAARSAHREAVECFDQALVALGHLPKARETLEQAIDLRLALRSSLHPLAELATTLVHLREAEGLARTLDDQRRLGWVSVYMSHHFRMIGDSIEARRFALSAHRIAESLDDASLQIAAKYYLGMADLALGDYRSAQNFLLAIKQSLTHDADRLHVGLTTSPAVMSRYHLAYSFAECGRFEEGIANGLEGVRLAEALDDPYALAVACLGLGYAYRVKGDTRDAAVLLERGLLLSHEWNLTLVSPILTWHLVTPARLRVASPRASRCSARL